MSDPITRSHSNYSAPRDANRVPIMLGVSTADGTTPLPLEVDPTSGELQISGAGGGLLSNVTYDYVAMSNADGNGNYQTIVYKSGGSGGTTKATLTITYDGNSNITSITRT